MEKILRIHWHYMHPEWGRVMTKESRGDCAHDSCRTIPGGARERMLPCQRNRMLFICSPQGWSGAIVERWCWALACRLRGQGADVHGRPTSATSGPSGGQKIAAPMTGLRVRQTHADG